MTRRRWLQAAAALAGAGIAGGGRILAQPKFREYPFSLGVASGEPTGDGVVLWTRLAPDPLNGGGIGSFDIPVQWQIATDRLFARIVRQGTAIASPEWAHSLHVEVDGLESDRWHWYRFLIGGAASPVGTTRTLPAGPAARLRLAVASCQHFEQGWFAAYRHMLGDDLDLVVHVGDYIYEGSWGARVRRHESANAAITLEDYRNRHACYKRDPDLAAAHAAYPWLVTWDDHDVANDYAGLVPNDDEPPAHFAARRAAAYRAYYEHMPLRASHRPDANGALTLFGRTDFGDLARIHLVDDRQYRSPHACAERGEILRDCIELSDPGRTLLGPRQERWLEDSLATSPARWNVLAQQTLIAPFVTRAADGGSDEVWTDGWDGYPGSRARLLRHVADAGVRNVVTLGGDMHAFYVADLKPDFADPGAPVVATEFVGSSITSDDVDYASVARDLPHNPHIRAFESRWRGYLYCEITPQLWRTDWRIVDNAQNAASPGRTLARFHVEDGRPGAQS